MEPHLTAAQRYFPTYKLDPIRQEIGLKEYDLSAKALEADHRSLTAATGIALFFAGTAATLISAGDSVKTIEKLSVVLGSSLEISLSLAILAVSLMAIYYFSCLQRSATYAARKIVILRRLLGLDYGNIETVLPSDRLEGANEPFSLPMFPGWSSLQALPVIAVAMLSAFAQGTAFTAFHIIRPRQMTFLGGTVLASPGEVGWLTAILTVAFLLSVYRYSLYEDFETLRLNVAKGVSKILLSPIKPRTGHVLYRMKLSAFEAKRLNINLESLHEMLIFIEDKRYYHHNGNSIRSVVAAAYRRVKFNRRSGGSTIYQQLSRSNFLTRFDAPFRRKIIEWLIAPWLCKQFSRSEGLNIYLCSVRFAYNVIGLPAAIAHYFPSKPPSEPLSDAEKFVLIERLSNVSSTYPENRIRNIVAQLESGGLLKSSSRSELNHIYLKLGNMKKMDLKGQIPSL